MIIRRGNRKSNKKKEEEKEGKVKEVEDNNVYKVEQVPGGTTKRPQVYFFFKLFELF